MNAWPSEPRGSSKRERNVAGQRASRSAAASRPASAAPVERSGRALTRPRVAAVGSRAREVRAVGSKRQDGGRYPLAVTQPSAHPSLRSPRRAQELPPAGESGHLVIESREQLLYLLTQACELEHGLMCEYLFAQWSLKTAAG